MLVISMVAGIAAYFIFVALPFDAATHTMAHRALEIVQPVLLFAMLFLSFCRVDIHDFRLRGWHKWLLLAQTLFFLGISAIIMILPAGDLRVVLEGAILCLICPTATASAVIVRKLDGDVAGVTTYLILINIIVAVLIPVVAPYIHPHQGMSVIKAMLLILAKVFPLLLMPLICAVMVEKWWPRFHRFLSARSDWSFYLWAVALALALTVTTRSIVHSTVSLWTQLALVAVSAVCCVAQFKLGWIVGKRYGDHVTPGQAMGQKNTVFVIWLGYTFFSPVTAVVGGFYSIWHNVINSWQLYRHNHPHAVSEDKHHLLEGEGERPAVGGDKR